MLFCIIERSREKSSTCSLNRSCNVIKIVVNITIIQTEIFQLNRFIAKMKFFRKKF